MNRERAAELLPIIKAFSEGEEIQRKGGGGWYAEVRPMWYEASEYRIKPKPREFWVWPHPCFTSPEQNGHPEQQSHACEAIEPVGGAWIKVREVLE